MPASIAFPAEFVEVPALARSRAVARFTLDGSEELENHLAHACEKVLAGIRKIIPPRKLEGLLLGGGYGRGEGGVLKTAAGDRPYNDLEFYVFVRGNNWLNEHRFGEALHRLAHELTPEAGVQVEFKIISSAKLRRSPPSMFYYDLVAGHRRLWGGEKLLAGCGHHNDARNIPLSEATRLLMNRCSGLLFARAKLQHGKFTDEDADYVGRNMAKAQLALGDAVLAVFGRYHWSCLERFERLRLHFTTETESWFEEVCQHYAAGVKFKLHPRQTSAAREILQTQHEEIAAFALKIWLWLESRRLGCNFKSARDYATNPLNKCPEENPWRNSLINVIKFGPAALLQRQGRRHPRERILNALALLLWGTFVPNSELQQRSCHELRPSCDDEANSVRIYQELWHRFN